MCGATGAQTQLQTEELAAYQQAQQMTAEQYANQQAIYGPMKAQFQSILEAGPNQPGFGAAETEDLNAQTVEGTAENYEGAAKAVDEKLAAEGGGDIPLTSGGAAQLKAEVAESTAQEQSRQESQIQQASYNQGAKEWEEAAGGLETIAAGENPLGFENAATSSGSAASNTANEIASEDNSWINAALGTAGSIGSSIVDQNPGGIFN